RKGKLLQAIHDLASPETVQVWTNFEVRIDLISAVFTEAKPAIAEAYASLGGDEISRLDEAIHDVLEGCNYSAIAMAVSAIEFRLLGLMKAATKEEGLDNLTLGQMINKVLTEKIYTGVIPEKHKALLQLCNTYRIFSVHAKTEVMTKALAMS